MLAAAPSSYAAAPALASEPSWTAAAAVLVWQLSEQWAAVAVPV
jgi:hypothetical protein